MSALPDHRQRPLRILIVEDEAIIALGLEQIVEDLGHEVCALVTTADAAVDAADRHHPDLVLMDVMLRGGSDGLEAARRIWERHGIRSLITSALDVPTLRERAAPAKPLGFVSKPYRAEDLRATLGAAR
ncbi:MAG TPA: response regulator [Azospirillaceae bacterium]|nr:response regulator [Azospirillaceae bacterium]